VDVFAAGNVDIWAREHVRIVGIARSLALEECSNRKFGSTGARKAALITKFFFHLSVVAMLIHMSFLPRFSLLGMSRRIRRALACHDEPITLNNSH
jgi:hypothetical protein